MMDKLIKVIINPKSGWGRWVEQEIGVLRRCLRDAPYQAEFLVTKRRGEGEEIARRAVKEGAFMVVAIGGDGTINEVARGLIGSSTILGIIPKGSGNGFARSLGIPLTIRRACEVLVRGNTRRIDVGYLAGKPFFNTAGFGLDSAIGWEYNRKRRRFRGFLPYFMIGVKEFFVVKREEVKFQLPGDSFSRRTLLVTLANGREYGSGIVISPDADPSDGKLDLCMIDDIGLIEGLFYLPFLFSRRIDRTSAYHRFRISEAIIFRERPGPIHIDGDPEMAGEELSVRIEPGRLIVRVP